MPRRGYRHPWPDVPVGVGPQEIPKRLKSHDRGSLQKRGTHGQAVELRQEGEDQGGDGAEELLIVTEENTEGFRGSHSALRTLLPPYGWRRQTAGEGARGGAARRGIRRTGGCVSGSRTGRGGAVARPRDRTPDNKGTEIFEAAIGAPAAQARLPPEGLEHWMRAMPFV